MNRHFQRYCLPTAYFRHIAWRTSLALWLGLLLTGLVGCESLERKFTRTPKHPLPSPNPIVTFEDYTRTMTPLDRYRKHYLMFDYWNDQLLQALQSPPLNSKRFRRASTEALGELTTMRQLVTDVVADRLAAVIQAREQVDRQLQRGDVADAQTQIVVRTLEPQTRQIHREFFWRDVEDQLKQ